jgi:hypothetical protein
LYLLKVCARYGLAVFRVVKLIGSHWF